MKYYITADIHGFYTEFHKALEEAGYFTDPEPHKLIILGDIFDRGQEAVEMQQFVLQLLEQGDVILVRGNHEDLYEEMITIDEGFPVRHHKSNGTYGTALQLTGYDPGLALIRNFDFAEAAQNTAYYRQIIPAMVDYYETAHYVFVHGWIPCIQEREGSYSHRSDWREATPEESHPRSGAVRGGSMGWTRRRPARKKRRSSAATGIVPTAMRGMKTKVPSSGRTRISVPTTAPA